MASSTKDTIYVDVDDEITSLIDKVDSSKQKIVALVLPKRAAVLQSTVNMRLLKRSADNGKKRVVLITSEAGLLPLAGAVGLHVARNLQSRPTIPPAPEKLVDEVATVDDSSDLEDVPLNAETPVGELERSADETETIELDDEDDAAELASAASKVPPKAKVKKDKGLKIPNFDKFRVLLAIGAVVFVGLIVFLYLALAVLPKATITLKTDTSTITATLNASTSGAAKTLDEEKKILPSVIKEKKQSDTEKVAATGSKDLGTKATGKVTIQNCEDTSSRTISSGITFILNSHNYMSTQSASVPAGSFSNGGSKCNSDSVTVAVAAAAPGDSYNQDGGAANTTSGALAGNFKITASDFTGGTTKIAKVVSQQDVDGAKAKIAAKHSTAAQDLTNELEGQGLYVLDETATSTDAQVTSVPAIGEEATEATVTQEITYSVLTVNKAELTKLLKAELTKQIDTKKQQLSPGDLLNKATVRVGEKKSKTDVTLSVLKNATAMPILKTDDLKKQVAGLKSAEIKSLIGRRPGVKDVQVSYSPFWVSKAPSKVSKITITIEQPDSDARSGN